MNSGKISYSPDYRALYDAACRAEHGSTVGRSFEEWCERVSDYGLANVRHALEVEISTERARLERAVIETSKAACLAEHEHTKDLTVETWEAMVAAQVLRDSAVDALLTFESEQEKKS